MQNHISSVKETLLSIIREMSTAPWLFVKSPERDFTRNRKLDFETLIRFFLSMQGGTLSAELLKYFDYSLESATASAFIQQRSKILPEAFEFLFHTFTDRLKCPRVYEGYRLLACDGSEVNIVRNPEDQATYFKNSSSDRDRGFNQLHLNALYDLKNHIYVDAIEQSGHNQNEYLACAQMIDRSRINGKVILVADRGYESYNTFAHAQEKGWNYLVRVKDLHSIGIVSRLSITEAGAFDKEYFRLLTRVKDRRTRSEPDKYKYVAKNQIFDYLPIGGVETYPMSFRVVRFLIGEDNYETVITNLPADQFPPQKLKEIYHLRWGIETSFCKLKYAIGLTHLHAKKVEYIRQELFAKLILYNFSETVVAHVVIAKRKKTEHTYQVNFTMAIRICREYLRSDHIRAPAAEALIKRYILPIRTGRQHPRRLDSQSAVGFHYRVA